MVIMVNIPHDQPHRAASITVDFKLYILESLSCRNKIIYRKSGEKYRSSVGILIDFQGSR